MRFRCFVLLILTAVLMTGCVRRDVFSSATESYFDGRYEEAEEYFQMALRERPDDALVRIGHGFNLIQCGDTEGAVQELETAFLQLTVTETDIEDIVNTVDALTDIYLSEERYEDAKRLLNYLAELDPREADTADHRLKKALTEEGLYRDDPEMFGAWKEAMLDIIRLKTYAEEEYITLLDVLKEKGPDNDFLSAVDDFVIYMNGHSAYIEDFGPLTTVLFEAGRIASHSEYANDDEHYYSAVESFLALAEKNGMDEQTLMKYRIILAERRGRMSTAARLLDVYLSHYPNDSVAMKEKSYLENRLGV